MILTFAAASFLVDWKMPYYCLRAALVVVAAAAAVVAVVVVVVVADSNDFDRQL